MGGKKPGGMALLKALACSISPKTAGLHFGRYAAKMQGGGAAVRIGTRTRAVQSLASLLGAFIGITAIGYVAFHFSLPFLLAPFGASAVLLFSVYDSPLAQPRNTGRQRR